MWTFISVFRDNLRDYLAFVGEAFLRGSAFLNLGASRAICGILDRNIAENEIQVTLWRRRRDSNPRDPFESNGFQDRRFQPLTHSSVFNSNVFCELAVGLLRLRLA